MKNFILGIDEAGRGCIAGSLFVCGVMIDINFAQNLISLGVKDSKKLKEEQRNKLALEIINFLQNNGFYFVEKFSAMDIDSNGLSFCLRCSLNNIKKNVTLDKLDNVEIIFDGNCNFNVSNIKTLIKGDEKNPVISAASIIAKFYKDKEMIYLDNLYPNFGFKRHKGYATKFHLDSIRMYGISEVHRKSFNFL